MNFFEQGENAMNPEGSIYGNDIHSLFMFTIVQEERKMTWIRETRIRLFMQMELEVCRNELDWIARIHDCLLNSCSEEDFPLMSLPITSTYVTYLERRTERAKKGLLTTYIKDDSKNVLSTTSTSVVRSSTASGNLIMLAITNAVH